MTDRFESMLHISNARRARWPDGDDPFRIVTRLAEEAGELASVVNHLERTGVKIEKHGEPDRSRIAAEALDVMLAALHLVQHYDGLDELDRQIDSASRSYGGVSESTD